MTAIHRVLWALIFVGILTGAGKLGWDHYQEGVEQAKAIDAIVTLDSGNIATTIIPGTPIMIMVCTPDICKELKPTMADLQKEYLGKAKIVMLDAMATGGFWQSLISITAQVLGPFPSAFPTAIMLDQQTKPVAYKVGISSIDELKALIDKALLPAPLTPAP